MTNAMRHSGVAPDEIDYIVAHGTATPLNDVTETRAIKAAYGEHAYKVAISSPKSMIGHLVGAAGIASALAATRRHPRRVIPPTANLRTPDPECDLDYVPLTARRRRSRRSRSTGSGSAARTRTAPGPRQRSGGPGSQAQLPPQSRVAGITYQNPCHPSANPPHSRVLEEP